MKILTDLKKVQFCDAIIKDGYLWGVNNSFPVLFRTNVDTFDVEIVCCFDSLVEEDFKPSNIFLHDKVIYVTSFNYGVILTYDMMSKKVDSICLCKHKRLYAHALLYENIIYFFPRDIKNEILAYNLLSQETTRIHIEPFSLKEDLLRENTEIINVKVDKGIAWSVLVGSNKILSIDLLSKQYKIYEVDGAYLWIDFFLRENEIFILDKNDYLVVVDKRNMNVVKAIKYDCLMGNYSHMIPISDMFILIPKYGCILYKCDYSRLKLEEFKVDIKEEARTGGGSLFYESLSYKDNIFFFPNRTNYLVVYNTENASVRKEELCFLEKNMFLKYSKRYIFTEKKKGTLGSFIELITYTPKNKFVNIRVNSGASIFKNLKGSE